MCERIEQPLSLAGLAEKPKALPKRSLAGKTQKSLAGGKWRYGVKRHDLWLTWQTMRNRCNNPNAKDYAYYGGRGIKICPRWDSFLLFVEDMDPRPTKKHQLDRRDNNEGYSPENCRWVTRYQQMRNTRRVKMIEHNGEKMCISQWAERVGLGSGVLAERIKSGWSIKDAIETPTLPTGRHLRIQNLSSLTQSSPKVQSPGITVPDSSAVGS